jgi:chemotaxis protein histidine kinase CheA
MGYQQIGTVNRQLEALFLLFKQGELSITSEYIQMVTNIVEHIENALVEIDKSEHEPDLEIDIETLKKHTNITS